MYYRINPVLPEWAHSILQQTLAGTAHAEPYRSDLDTVQQMPNRPGAACCA
jgi:ArsR family transcriptional regulator